MKSIGEYLASRVAESAVAEAFEGAAYIDEDGKATKQSTLSNNTRIRARTARRWLDVMGLSSGKIKRRSILMGTRGKMLLPIVKTLFCRSG